MDSCDGDRAQAARRVVKFTVDSTATVWACRPHLKKYGHDDGMADGTARWDPTRRMTASFKNFRTTENPCWVRELVEPFPTPPPFVNCHFLHVSTFVYVFCLLLSTFVYVCLSLTNTLLQVFRGAQLNVRVTRLPKPSIPSRQLMSSGGPIVSKNVVGWNLLGSYGTSPCIYTVIYHIAREACH